MVVTGEDLEEGKPSPDPFRTALVKMGLAETEAIVVENAPLGVKAANNAGIRCIVTLNNTPLKISDFDGLIAQESIFPNTGAASSFVEGTLQKYGLGLILYMIIFDHITVSALRSLPFIW